MTTLTVGIGGAFATILEAMAAADDGDTIALLSDYRDETVEVTRRDLTFIGDASNTGILLTLAAGITHVTLAGTAPIDVIGNAEDNIVILSGAGADIGELTVALGSGNDTLIIDNPDGGLLLGTITYHGGGDPADALEIRGGAVTSIAYMPSSPHDGTLEYTGAQGALIVHFTGLAPVIDTVPAASLTINGPAASDTFIVSEGGAGQTTVDSQNIEEITFANKTSVTVNGAGGTNTLAFADQVPATGLSTFIVTTVSTITQTLPVGYPNLNLAAAASITLENALNDVDNFAASVSGLNGAIRFRDLDGFTVGGVSTNGGPVTLRNDAGAMTIGTATASTGIDSGANFVRLQSGTTVTQSSNGAIVSGLLGVRGSGNILLTAAPNDNDVLTINTTGLVEYRDVGTVIIQAVSSSGAPSTANAIGVTSGGSNINLQIGGNLILNDAQGSAASIDAGAGDVRLNVTGTISQTNADDNIVANELGIRAGGAVTLEGNNDVDILAAAVARALSFNDTDGLSIGTLAASGSAGFTPDAVGVTTSGSNGHISLTAAGSIILDTSNADIRATSGNVFVSAAGATSNVEVRNDSTDAIDSSAGNVTIFAGQDILLGSAVDDDFGDAEANGNLTLSAGRDVVVDENTFVEAFGAGTLTVGAGRHISILASDGTGGSKMTTQGGAITLTTGADGLLTVSSASTGAIDSTLTPSADGAITINADRANLASGTITAGTSTVTLAGRSVGRLINLGSATDVAASTLELSDPEIDRITAGIVHIGGNMSGPITLTAGISAAGTGTLSLQSNNAIVDGTGTEQADITETSLALRAADGIGATDDLDIAVGTLAFSNSGSANVVISNTGALTIGAVDGLTASSNSGAGTAISATGALTVAAGVSSGVSVFALAGDTVTLNAGVSITAGIAVNLTAGDDFIFGAGATITASSAVSIFIDADGADAGVGATADLKPGTINASSIAVTGGPDNDIITGGAAAETLNGSGGNDTLGHYGGAADSLDGGAGVDTADFSGFTAAVWVHLGQNLAYTTGGASFLGNLVSIENVTGTSGNDALIGNGDANRLEGGSGDDFVMGEGGNDELVYGGGLDTFDGGSGTDTATFAGFGSTIWANLGARVAYTTGGASHLADFTSIENLVGTGGNDALIGDGGANRLEGGAGNDLLMGGGGNDALIGGLDDDTLDYGGGSNLFDGGSGSDTVTFAGFGPSVWVHLGQNLAYTTGGASFLGDLVSIENVTGTTGNDSLIGNGAANRLEGGAGDDFVMGEGGNDELVYGGGLDTFDGGSRTDTATFAGFGPSVWVHLGQNLAYTTGGASHLANLSSIENLVGTGGNDALIGNGDTNRLEGGSGDDFVMGEGGNDELVYGGGLDTFDGGSGADTATFAGFGSSIWANLGAGVAYTTGGASHLADFTSIENLVGTGGNDTLIGDGNANRLEGGAGDDFVMGEGGSDELVYGGGLDTFDGGNGVDTATFAGFGSTIWASLGANAAYTTGGASHLADFTSIENLVGTGGNDTLIGNGGANRIIGGGNDFLIGDAGSDTFVYRTLGDRGTSGDTVADFAKGAGGDVLDLRELLQTFAGYNGSNAFGGGYLQFLGSGGNTQVQVDIDGGANGFVTLATLSSVLLQQTDTANFVI